MRSCALTQSSQQIMKTHINQIVIKLMFFVLSSYSPSLSLSFEKIAREFVLQL